MNPDKLGSSQVRLGFRLWLFRLSDHIFAMECGEGVDPSSAIR